MEFRVKVFLDGILIEPSGYPKIIIANPAVDRIVNDIFETSAEEEKSTVA